MTTPAQLTLYNGALAAIGARRLTSTTENLESRRALDDVWNRGAINTCLAAGLWNFAARGIQWDYNPDYSPSWGYQCLYDLPTDWIRWIAVCVDPYLQAPLLQYNDEGEFFCCDLERVWVRYVSNNAKFGMNWARWPDNFQRYVELYLAAKVALRLTGSQQILQDAMAEMEKALKKAKSTDAMNEATTMLPPGNWRQARHGRRRNFDRGNPNSLYGY